VTWVRSFRTCERIEHKHEHEHEHEHEIRVGAQYVSHAARAKLPETNMNMNTNTRKRTGPMFIMISQLLHVMHTLGCPKMCRARQPGNLSPECPLNLRRAREEGARNSWRLRLEGEGPCGAGQG